MNPLYLKDKSQEVDSTKADRDNRANQKNPNHEKSGPGQQAGYGGDGSKADRDNHGNQKNPKNEKTNN